MSNEFYNASGAPSTGSSGSSAVQRAEFVAIAAGFALLPTMLGNSDLPVFVNGTGTALTSVSAASARTKLGLVISTDVQAWDADLDALAALDATVGVLIKTAAATYARRNVVGTANEITVTNGNGVAGNITLSLPAALTFTGKTVSGGTFNNSSVTNANIVQTGNAQISGGVANNIAITNSTFSGTTGTFSGALTAQALLDISGAAAGQIKFPAAQNASAGANTLDDYEEGTWTPSDASGAGLAFTVAAASYTKVGRMVQVDLDFTFPATGSGANTQISGLPFTSTTPYGGMFSFYNTTAGVMTWQINPSGTTFFGFTTGGAQVTNATLSGKQTRNQGIYLST